MWITLIIIALLLAGLAIYLLRFDGRFEVERELIVEAPVKTVFETVADFRSWPEWNPWLLHEPDAKIEYSDDCSSAGGFYSWEGQLVGSGRLTHIELEPTRRIDQQIDFRRPFKARNRVSWKFEDQGERTRVSWGISGKLPLPVRFLASRMEAAIKRDYDFGLARLNGHLNPSAPHPAIEFGSIEKLEDFSYWAIPFRGKLRQLEAARQSGIETLLAAAANNGLGLMLYYRFDPEAALFQAEIAVPISTATPHSNYTRREFRGGTYLKMTMQGDHRFLPLGWHLLYSHCRMTKTKIARDRPALEIYHDDPTDRTIDSNRLTTALYVPVKASPETR